MLDFPSSFRYMHAIAVYIYIYPCPMDPTDSKNIIYHERPHLDLSEDAV